MKVLFYMGHPAHFHLFRNTIISLIDKGHLITVLIKKKDILEELLKKSGINYYNILPEGRKDSKFGITIGVLKRDWRLFRFCISSRPDLMLGTSVEIGHIGSLLKIPSINVNEDDANVVPLYSKLSYPWASHILSPVVCNNGKWEKKSIKYEGYHELAYLHPDHFVPSKEIVEKYINTEKPYFLLRFAKLNAHHDKGVKGISNELALKIICILKPFGNIYITSERILDDQFKDYRLKIDPLDIHHIMSFASIYIGDSQTMAAESGVLGVPFIRFNDFVGRIGYLAELENKYNLGFGIKTHEEDLLFSTLNSLLRSSKLKEAWLLRRQKMLKEKIEFSSFLIGLIEKYPESVEMKKSILNKS